MNDELRALGNVRTRGLLLLALVAVAAGAAGGAIDRVWVARGGNEREPLAVKYEPQTAGTERRNPEPGRLRTDRSMEEGRPASERGGLPISLRSLDLSPDQRTRIERISARFQPAADSVITSIRDRVAALDLRMRQEAMCVLTPKQRDAWLDWRKRERLIIEPNNEMMKLVTAGVCPK